MDMSSYSDRNHQIPPQFAGRNDQVPPALSGRDHQVPSPLSGRNYQDPPPFSGRNHEVPIPLSDRNHQVPPPLSGRNYQVPPTLSDRNHEVPIPLSGRNYQVPPPASGRNYQVPPPLSVDPRDGIYSYDQPSDGQNFQASPFPGQNFIHSSVVVTQPNIQRHVVNTSAPPDYTIFAILSCFFCFCPTGIFAIIFAVISSDAAARGDMENARRNSYIACFLSTLSVVCGITWVICVIMYSNGSLL